MKAVILAGGKGTRLIPYSAVFPKPLVPIGDKPILDIVMRQLSYYGFNEVILSVGYLAELIQAYFQHSPVAIKTNLSFVKETKPLGTAGSLSLIPDPKEPFLVMNGDILTTLNFAKLLNCHREKKPALTIAIKKREVKIDLGVIEVDERNHLISYREKPTHNYLVSMGIYIYEPRVLKYLEKNEYLDFPSLVLRLLKNGEEVICYLSEDYWMDIGRHEDYAKVAEDFERMGEEAFFKRD
jgi:NDP-sugar pyrophosphorylase family protein